MYVVLVEFEIKLNHFSNFKNRVLQQAKDSLALETDCHLFDVCKDNSKHNHLVLYEHYSNKAAFDRHIESSHFKAFGAEVAPWILSKSVRILQTVDQAN